MLSVPSNLNSECQLSIDLQLETIIGSLSEFFFEYPTLGQWRMFIILQKKNKNIIWFFPKNLHFQLENIVHK